MKSSQKVPKGAKIPRIVAQDYKLARAVRQEYKIWDKDLAVVGVGTSGAIYSLATAGSTTAALTRGSDYLNNFIGQNMDIAGIQFRYQVTGAVSNAVLTADQNNITRVMLFQWMDSTTPTLSGVLQTAAAGQAVLSPVLATNRENINILHDQAYSTWCQTSVATEANSNGYVVRKYIKGYKLSPVQMDTGSATYQKGGLYVLVVSDSSVTPNPSFNFYCRTTFTE